MMCNGYLQWSSLMCDATMILAEYGEQDLIHLEYQLYVLLSMKHLDIYIHQELRKTKDTIGRIFTQPICSHQCRHHHHFWECTLLNAYSLNPSYLVW